MGGDVTVTSTVGRGSTFTLTVELNDPPAQLPPPIAEAPVPAPPAPPGALRLHRVLLVEDDRTSQFVSKRMVEKAGFVVEVASGGLEAVSLATTGRFAVILMDCQMPDIDGYEATRRIRAHESPSLTTRASRSFSSSDASSMRSLANRQGSEPRSQRLT